MRTPHINLLCLLTFIIKKQKAVKEGHNRMSTKASCADEHHTLTKNKYIGSCSCFKIFPIIHLARKSKIHVAHPNYLGLRLITMLMMMTTFSKEGVYRFREKRKDIFPSSLSPSIVLLLLWSLFSYLFPYFISFLLVAWKNEGRGIPYSGCPPKLLKTRWRQGRSWTS